MPYSNIWEKKGVLKKFQGVVTGGELLQSVIDVEEDPRFDEILYVLSDFLEIDDLVLNEKEVSEIAAVDKAAAISNSGILMAIVVDRKGYRYWAFKYKGMTEDSLYVVEIFDQLSEARKWIEKSILSALGSKGSEAHAFPI